MDSKLFEEWVCGIDKKMELEGRKIALVVDNCPAHPHVSNLKAVKLTFLPPNTTSKTQPMDMGVIRSLKARYRRSLIRKMIRAVELKKPLPNISILDAMLMLQEAWSDLPADVIANCFKHAGISAEAQERAVNDEDDPFFNLQEENDVDLQASLDRLKEIRPDLLPEDVDAKSMIDIDVATSTHGEFPTDEEIINEASGAAEDPDDEDDDEEIVVVDEAPRRPSCDEVNDAIELLNMVSLFANKGDAIRMPLEQLKAAIEEDRDSRKRQVTIEHFFA